MYRVEHKNNKLNTTLDELNAPAYFHHTYKIMLENYTSRHLINTDPVL